MILLVDAGNSGVKWGLLRQSGITPGTPVRHGARFAEGAGAVWSLLEPPERVVVSNVAGLTFAVDLATWVRSLWGIDVEFVVPLESGFGIHNAYTEPGRLGSDRWCALVAAAALDLAPCLVVDSGTALTIDALAGDGRHEGGVIVPGIELMRRSLTSGTRGISDLEGGAVSLLAADTAGAVHGGTLYTAVAAIDRITADVVSEWGGEGQRVITGGDAGELLPLLNATYHYEPDLVLKGLAVIATGDKQAIRPEADTTGE
jgi:type III pantothenate kinase